MNTDFQLFYFTCCRGIFDLVICYTCSGCLSVVFQSISKEGRNFACCFLQHKPTSRKRPWIWGKIDPENAERWLRALHTLWGSGFSNSVTRSRSCIVVQAESADDITAAAYWPDLIMTADPAVFISFNLGFSPLHVIAGLLPYWRVPTDLLPSALSLGSRWLLVCQLVNCMYAYMPVEKGWEPVKLSHCTLFS